MIVDRAHGYARYVLDSCRCAVCAAAVTAYFKALTPAEPNHNPFVLADPVRAHVLALGETGLTLDQIAQMAWLTPETLAELYRARVVKIASHTAARLMSIPIEAPEQESRARVSGDHVWAMIDALLAAGWTKQRVATEILGTRQLQLARKSVSAAKARLVEAAYRKEFGEPQEAPSITAQS